jgi:hypothetical protein
MTVFIKDRDTVTAISGTTLNGVAGIWSIDGHMVRRKTQRKLLVCPLRAGNLTDCATFTGEKP